MKTSFYNCPRCTLELEVGPSDYHICNCCHIAFVIEEYDPNDKSVVW